MSPEVARMMAHQQALLEQHKKADEMAAQAKPVSGGFVMPKKPTLDEMMTAFVEDRQYENERIETPDTRKPAEPENIFEAALAAARNQNAAPAGQFAGPSTFDPDFIRAQLMKEQPDEYFCGGVTADGDSDPLGLYKTANERADGIVRSVMA